jgi:hypothetical protein
MSRATKNANFEITWPLYDEGARKPLPVDPAQELRAYAPPSTELEELANRTDFPDSTADERAQARRLRESLPPEAPEWMRAARALAVALERLIARGQVDAVEQAAIARAYAAWSLGGVSETHILRVAHLVSRAHQAIREARVDRRGVEVAYKAAASVLHTNLPSAIRVRMPFERALNVVRELKNEADAWAAVVEGTAELLGWKHYARVHAASVIRAVLERGRVHVSG